MEICVDGNSNDFIYYFIYILTQNINDAAKDRFQDLADDLKQKTENVLKGNGVKKKLLLKKLISWLIR
jgi:lipopolysaccharide biosynthesis glycosyltransferase